MKKLIYCLLLFTLLFQSPSSLIMNIPSDIPTTFCDQIPDHK